MVRTEVKISMKKKYSACLYFKLLYTDIKQKNPRGHEYQTLSSGIGRTMKPERSDGSDLRWKRSETKADQPRGQRRF
jgi:hypothetical protein